MLGFAPLPSPPARLMLASESRALRSDYSSVQESLPALPCTRCAHSISRRSAAHVGKPAFVCDAFCSLGGCEAVVR
eukprot:scaffold23091_cov55-Phaeocystis_antarctica.AAC.4